MVEVAEVAEAFSLQGHRCVVVVVEVACSVPHLRWLRCLPLLWVAHKCNNR